MPRFKGKNSLSARDMLIQRSVYNGYSLAELQKVQQGPIIETLQIKDFLKDEKLLIGRVDPGNIPVFPNEEYLTSFTSDANVVLDPVSVAFNNMKLTYDNALRSGQISRRVPKLAELNIQKAYTSPNVEYLKYSRNKSDQFRRYVISKNIVNKIINFDTFVPHFLDFVRITALTEPFTSSMFYISRKNSPLTSGLMIELDNGPYDDDAYKIANFYKNRNFEYFKNLAYAHGFVIDKHIPWRLIADLNSPNFAPWIEVALGVPGNAELVFLTMYNQTYNDEMADIKNIMVRCYNNIVQYRPQSKLKDSVGTVSVNGNTYFNVCKSTKLIERRPTSVEQIESKYSNSFFIDKLVRTKNHETGLGYDEALLRNIIENASNLSERLDMQSAIDYIVTKFDNLSHYEGSLFYDVTKIDFAADGRTGEELVNTVKRSVQASNFVIY
tara:strand:+ start:1050 stop:2369 length:1320 start_codon:yes stop_codon:yes gene_type:complete